jgi:hypothetical protein
MIKGLLTGPFWRITMEENKQPIFIIASQEYSHVDQLERIQVVFEERLQNTSYSVFVLPHDFQVISKDFGNIEKKPNIFLRAWAELELRKRARERKLK